MHPYLRFAAFLASVLLVYLGVHYYLSDWTVRHFAASGSAPALTRLLFWGVALLTVSAMLFNRAHPSPAAIWTIYCAYIIIGIIFLWFSYAVMSDMTEITLKYLRPGLDYGRVFGWLVLCLAALSSLWAVLGARKPPAFKHIQIAVEGLPAAMDGFTIVQLSDLHLSHTVHISQVREAFNRLYTLEPDLYLFTGDIVDPGFPEEEEFQALCKKLKSRYGSFGVLGNHEYYYGVGKAVRFYERSGIRLLRQETVALPNSMQLAGIDDIREGRLSEEDIRATLTALDPQKPSILLAHQPKKLELAAEKGVTLALSGHTHGGQVFPFNLLVKIAFPKYHYGLHRLNKTWIYITSGTFYWGPPMRFFTRSEIPVISLMAK